MDCGHFTGLHSVVLPRCLAAPSGKKLGVWAGKGGGFQGYYEAGARGRGMKWCWRLWKCRTFRHRSSSKWVVGTKDLGMSLGALFLRMLLATNNKKWLKVVCFGGPVG